MKFLDQVKIFIIAGDGGSGSPSFRREKFIEFGGPDGGDGGKGGSVVLKSERNLNTLIDYRYQQHFKAEKGEDGTGKNKTGCTYTDCYDVMSGDQSVLKLALNQQPTAIAIEADTRYFQSYSSLSRDPMEKDMPCFLPDRGVRWNCWSYDGDCG
jgi:hypothetical protein